MSTVDLLLAELHACQRGTVAHGVQETLASAWDRLIDVREGAGSRAVDEAADEIGRAIEALQLYRARLEELAGDLESIEQDLALMESDDPAVGEDGAIGFSGT